MTSKDVKAQLDSLEGVESLRLIVNSPGGDVMEGYAIYNLLNAFPGEVVAEVIGGAMSAMSVIILAADRVLVRDASVIMIHNPWTVAMGDSEAFLSTAAHLQAHEQLLAKLYGKRLNKTPEEMRELMTAETYFFPDEAVAFGFADEIVEGVTQIGNSADMVRHCKLKGAELQAKLTAVASEGLSDKLAAMRERRALAM